MHEALEALLLGRGRALADEVAGRLCARKGSAFRARGADATARSVALLLELLREDLAGGGARQLRARLREALAGLSEGPPGFHDLRQLGLTLRSALLDALERESLPRTSLRAVDDWCFELAQQCGLFVLTLREELIARQAGEIEVKLAEQRQLSIPVAPVHAGIAVVPLVGALDASRAQVLTERVLAAVTQTRAQVVLLDITGAPRLDREIAGHLVRTARAVRLLGAQLGLVGISPAAAQAMVALAIDTSALVALGSLQEGIAYALERLGLTIAPSRGAADRR